MANPVMEYWQSSLQRLEKAINNQPPKQYYMVMLLLVLLLIKFAFVPLFSAVQDRVGQLQQLATSVKSPEGLAEQLVNTEQSLVEFQSLQNFSENAFFTGSVSKVKVDAVALLKQTAADQELLYLQSRWLKTKSNVSEQFELIEPLYYSVLIRGEQNKVNKLIQQWQTMKPIVQIDEMRYRGTASEGVVAVTIKLYVFRVKESK